MLNFNGAVVFLGDSFTWGQGLHYYYMMENHGWSESYCKKFFDSRDRFEWLGFEADEYRRKHSYPYIVSKELNKMMVNPFFENGGDNKKIIETLQNLDRVITTNNVEYIVVQFSHPLRRIDVSEHKSVDDLILEQIRKVNHSCDSMYIKWFGFSWLNDVSKIIKENYPDNFVPILYNDKEHLSMEHTNQEIEDLFIRHNSKIDDSHPNKKGHEVIAKSIINKIKLSGE